MYSKIPEKSFQLSSISITGLIISPFTSSFSRDYFSSNTLRKSLRFNLKEIGEINVCKRQVVNLLWNWNSSLDIIVNEWLFSNISQGFKCPFLSDCYKHEWCTNKMYVKCSANRASHFKAFQFWPKVFFIIGNFHILWAHRIDRNFKWLIPLLNLLREIN